jgi:hypothetical protein
VAVLRFTTISNFVGSCTGRSLGFSQNAIHIGGGATKEVHRLGSVGDQTALSGIDRLVIDRWYVVSGRRRYDRRAMPEHESVRHSDNPASRLAPRAIMAVSISPSS